MTATKHTAQQLQRVLGDLADVLDGIALEQDGAPTPCTEFDVAELRQHVVGWLTAFADGYADPAGLCSDASVVTVDGTGGNQVRDLAAQLKRLLPAAAVKPLSIGGGSMPGDLAASMMLWEYQMHGWDLARATGQSWSPAEDGLRASLEFAPTVLSPESQGEGKIIGPRVEVSAGSSVLDQLLGLSGRDPRWQPA